MMSGVLVHRQDVKAGEHGCAGRMTDVSKTFRKLPCDGPREAGADGWILDQKTMSLTWNAYYFALEIDQEAGVEKIAGHAQGLSGAWSVDWAFSK